MIMTKATVCKIRPITWKICVQGCESAQYVRSVLERAGFQTTNSTREPDLLDPAVHAFVASPKGDTPMNAQELMALMSADPEIEIAFAEASGR
jgi:hypothetical protein